MPDESELIPQLRSALAHLDDPAYLEKHPLASRISFVAQMPELSRGQALRRALRLAVATLDPGGNTLGGPLEARSYQILYRWAVARQGMVSIAVSLGISRRQAYRDLHRAIEALAQVLGGAVMGLARERDSAGEVIPALAAQMDVELERLSRVTDEYVDLKRLVAEVVESAGYLAHERGIRIRLLADTPALHTTVNRVMLRQAILNLLSHLVSLQKGGSIVVHLGCVEQEATIQVICRSQASLDLPRPRSPYEIAAQLLRSLGIAWTEEEVESGTFRIRIRVPLSQERKVLIVEDNEGVIALFRRYLQKHPYRVYGATNADEALTLLDQLQPDAVILDVMMPNRDGWEVLQMLRARPAGARTRFVVCSIINDPMLATALGAHAFLNKPVEQSKLLQVLAEVLASST